MGPRLICAKVRVPAFHIEELALLSPRHLGKRVVIRCPKYCNRQSCEYLMVLGDLRVLTKLIDQKLVQAPAISLMLIGIVLRQGN